MELELPSGVDRSLCQYYKLFDVARDEIDGNCLPVSGMGVLSVNCQGGLATQDLFMNGSNDSRRVMVIPVQLWNGMDL